MACRACLLIVTSLLAACTATVEPVAPPKVVTAAAPPAAAVPTATAWPAGDTCRSKLAAAAALPEAERQHLDPATSPLAVTVIGGGLPVPPDLVQTGLTLDLPIRTTAPAGAPCLLLVELAPTVRSAPRQPLAHAIVPSTYRRGTQRVANPAHEALRRKVRELEGDPGDDVIATGDPTIDLIGLVAGGLLNGIGSIWRGRAESEARAALAATPASFAEPVWEPYTYQLTTVETERTGQLRATLIERAQGLSWPLEQTVHERRRFKVAVGRLPKDRDLLESRGGDVVTTADVTVWERGGLRPSLTWLATALPTGPAAGMPGDMAAVVATWTATPHGPLPGLDRADDETMDATVAITGHTTGSTSVEQVVTADGVRRYQLVEPAAEGQDHP